MQVRALQPVAIDRDTIKQPGDEWEATPEFANELIALGQLVECKPQSMIVVPELGLYVPNPTPSIVETAE